MEALMAGAGVFFQSEGSYVALRRFARATTYCMAAAATIWLPDSIQILKGDVFGWAMKCVGMRRRKRCLRHE